MFSWWNGSASADASRQRDRASADKAASRRAPVKQQLVQIEVIGGGSARSETTLGVPLSPRRRRFARPPVVGPPRLPRELISHIVLLAADDLAVEAHGSQSARKDVVNHLLRLASIDHASHAIVLSIHILPSLCLTGVRQLDAFSRALIRNTLDMQTLIVKVKRLHICRITPADHANRSLYADVEETARFERTTLQPLRTILQYCKGLESLSTDMTARALDLRWPEDMGKGGLLRVGNTLKELVTMMSLFGGEFNERLWDLSYGAPPAFGSPRWANLTHLQLHGPRFRMTALTALALCELPRLTNLALIMPWLVNSNVGSVSPTVLTRHAQTIERASDAVGRQSVLQLLLSGIGHRLANLVVVCHDMEGYLGSVHKVGPWVRALQWQHIAESAASSIANDRDDLSNCAASTQLTLVTTNATILQTCSATESSNVEPHPSVVSKWMLRRTREQRHWYFMDGEQDEMQGVSVRVAVETWKVPLVRDTPLQAAPIAHAEGYPDTSRTWSIRQHQQERQQHDVSPIDDSDLISALEDNDGGIDSLD